MIWKTVLVISVAHNVLCEHEKSAVSEQKVTIHHLKSHNNDNEHGHKKSEHHEEYAWTYPSYEFSYKVHDPHTHDIKGQNEKRHGDEVKGIYWLLEPNGHKRTVNYHASDHKGFNAQVDYSPYENHNEHKDDSHGYSVYEEQIEKQVENKNEENKSENNKKEEIVEEEEEKKEEANEEINKEPEKNEENKKIEKHIDDYKENESIVDKRIWIIEEDGENVEVLRRTNEFNVNKDDNDKQHSIQENIHNNHGEMNEKNEKYLNRSESRKRIILPHNDHINSKRGFIKQEKKKQQSKSIGNNNSIHKNTRRKEDTIKIKENETTLEDRGDESKYKNNQISLNKAKSENEVTTDKINAEKLDVIDSQNNNDKHIQVYQHRIYINHPKFSTATPQEKKHQS